jgi:hypothetical protein
MTITPESLAELADHVDVMTQYKGVGQAMAYAIDVARRMEDPKSNTPVRDYEIRAASEAWNVFRGTGSGPLDALKAALSATEDADSNPDWGPIPDPDDDHVYVLTVDEVFGCEPGSPVRPLSTHRSMTGARETAHNTIADTVTVPPSLTWTWDDDGEWTSRVTLDGRTYLCTIVRAEINP